MKLEYSKESGTHFVMLNGTQIDLTADDEDDAIRELALRMHLQDWTHPIQVCHYDNKLLIVNEHQVLRGHSPEEIRELINWVKSQLSKILIIQRNGLEPPTSMPYLHELSLKDLAGFGYHSIHRACNMYCQAGLQEGTHKLVNTLFFLVEETVRGPAFTNHEQYVMDLRAAWDGQPLVDHRTPEVVNDGEYLVVTEEEADKLWDDDLENYLEDCLEIPTHLRPYFDEEKWKRDAKQDGRGSSLARYDGIEYTICEIDDQPCYYIYRTN